MLDLPAKPFSARVRTGSLQSFGAVHQNRRISSTIRDCRIFLLRHRQTAATIRHLYTFDSYPTLSLFTLSVRNSPTFLRVFFFSFSIHGNRLCTSPMDYALTPFLFSYLVPRFFFPYVSRFDGFFLRRQMYTRLDVKSGN